MALLKAPPVPETTAACASLCKLINFGRAVAERIPNITITTTNSINVKPLTLFTAYILND
jgi:hypothetical protein